MNIAISAVTAEIQNKYRVFS